MGFGLKDDGDNIELQICEGCFFETVGISNEQRRSNHNVR